jgi:hypothetical protein
MVYTFGSLPHTGFNTDEPQASHARALMERVVAPRTLRNAIGTLAWVDLWVAAVAQFFS